MHILLTDVLTCPQCGPQYGLILLADLVRERRVYEGVLGCPNCRTQYPVRQGGAALGAAAHSPSAPDDPARAERLAALMGTMQGVVLVVGPASAHAAAMAEVLPDVEVITSAWGVTSVVAREESPGVSRLGFAHALPLGNSKMHAVTLSGPAADTLLEEGARVVALAGRLVLEPPPADAEERLRTAGFRVLARDGERLVAVRSS